jgi:hypothetical protein
MVWELFIASHARRTIHWLIFAGSGVIDSGELDLAVAPF